MDRKEWQEGVTVLLGMWILISPMVLGFAPSQREVTWNLWAVGVVLLIVAAGRAAAQVPKVWQEAANLILGIWLMLSPWVLGFATHSGGRNSTIVAGLVIAALALWALLEDIDVRSWMQERHLMR